MDYRKLRKLFFTEQPKQQDNAHIHCHGSAEDRNQMICLLHGEMYINISNWVYSQSCLYLKNDSIHCCGSFPHCVSIHQLS